MSSRDARCGNPQCPADASPVKLKLCADCRTVNYCSVACQRSDWRLHKPICRASTPQQGGSSRAATHSDLFSPAEPSASEPVHSGVRFIGQDGITREAPMTRNSAGGWSITVPMTEVFLHTTPDGVEHEEHVVMDHEFDLRTLAQHVFGTTPVPRAGDSTNNATEHQETQPGGGAASQGGTPAP